MITGRLSPLALSIGSAVLLGLFIGSGLSAWGYAVVAWTCALTLITAALVGSKIGRSSISPLPFVIIPGVFYGLILPWLLVRRQRVSILGVDYSPWYVEAITITGVAIAAYVSAWLFCSFVRPLTSIDTIVLPDRTEVYGGAALLGLALLFAVLRFALYGIGGQLFVQIGADTSRAQGASAYLIYAPQYLASVCLYLAYRSTQQSLRRLSQLLFGVLLLYFLAAGVRYIFVVYAVAAALLILWRRTRTLALPHAYLLAAGVVLVVLIGWIGANRNSTMGPGIAIADSALQSVEILNPLAATVATVEDDGFELGATYTYLVIQPIPRQLWPGKPEPAIRDFIGRFSTKAEGRAFPLWGEMFANFGYPGVVVGMFGFGLLGRWFLATWLRARHRLPGVDVVGALVLPFLIQVISRGYLVAAVHTGFALLGGPIVLLWLEHSRSRRELRRTGGWPAVTAPGTVRTGP